MLYLLLYVQDMNVLTRHWIDLVENQGDTRDVIKDDFGGKLLSGRPHASAFTPRRGFIRGRVFTVCQRGKNRVRTDAPQLPRGHEKK
jgi:hypothetical protein